jgi:hypothetical protein
MVKNKCSDGTWVTKQQIRNNYGKARKERYEGVLIAPMCEGCGKEKGSDNDHTIAQARCKVIHKTELIWHFGNFVWSCRTCHRQWENFKSGEWVHHNNVEQRLRFLKENDPEGYIIRIELTQWALEQNTAA